MDGCLGGWMDRSSRAGDIWHCSHIYNPSVSHPCAEMCDWVPGLEQGEVREASRAHCREGLTLRVRQELCLRMPP